MFPPNLSLPFPQLRRRHETPKTAGLAKSRLLTCQSYSCRNSTNSTMVDEATKKTLSNIPLMRTNAGPRDKEAWVNRLKEEYRGLIAYVENSKANDMDWFRLESNKEGTRWFGKCWHVHDLLK